jgi:hypothetical protein
MVPTHHLFAFLLTVYILIPIALGLGLALTSRRS